MGTFKAGTIQAFLELKADKFVAGIKKADKRTQGLRESMDRLSQGLGGIAVRATAAFAGLATGIGLAVKVGAAFQDEIINVGAVAGVAGKQLEEMERIAIDAGEATKFSATEAAKAMFNLASQGVKGADAFKNLLKPALDLAAASQTDVAFTSEIVLTTIKAFRLEFTDAAKVANVFSAANENSALTVERLALALKPVAPVAGALGIEIEEVTAVLGVLVSSGFQAEEAGTALRNIFLRIQKPVGKAKKILDKAGLSIERLGKLSKDPARLIEALRDANLSTADSLEIFGTRAVAAFLTLKENVPEIDRLTKAVTGTNSAADIAAIQLRSFGNQAKLLLSKIQTLAIEIFKTVEPALRAMIDVISGIVVKIVEFVRENRGLTKVLLLGATAVTGAVAAITGLAALVASAGVAFLSFKIGMAGVTALLPAFASGLSLAAVGMLALQTAGVALVGVLAFQFGKFLNKLIKDKFPALDKAINGIVRRLIGLTAELESVTGTTADTADRFDRLANAVEGFAGRKTLGNLKAEAKRLGIEFKNIPPSLKEALKTAGSWENRAAVLREHAGSIRKATAKIAADQKKAADEAERAAKALVAGVEDSREDVIDAPDPEAAAKRREEGLKLLDSLKDELAFRDVTRDQESLIRLNGLVEKRILSEREVAGVKAQLEEKIRLDEAETQRMRESAFAQQLEAITGATAAFAKFLEDGLLGNKTLKESFKDLGKSILVSIVSALAKAVAKALILDGIMKQIGKNAAKGAGKGGKKGGGILGAIGSLFGPVGGAIGGAIGGILPFQAGGLIPRGEDGLIAAQAGELILSRSTVSALGGGGAAEALQSAIQGGMAGGGTTIQLKAVLETATGDVPQGTVDRFAEQIIDRLNFRFGAFTGAS
jgi:TP901 family phage tail tape measure protein